MKSFQTSVSTGPDMRETVIRPNYSNMRTFQQAPPLDRFEREEGNEGRLKGMDLFAHFTADIIKENVTFTR